MPLGQAPSGIKEAMKGFLDKGNVGPAQANTPNVPQAPAPEGGLTLPSSQLGPVMEGDTITLTVVAVNGDTVSLEKVEEPAMPAGEEPLPPIQ
jgi:hypothetical protein